VNNPADDHRGGIVHRTCPRPKGLARRHAGLASQRLRLVGVASVTFAGGHRQAHDLRRRGAVRRPYARARWTRNVAYVSDAKVGGDIRARAADATRSGERGPTRRVGDEPSEATPTNGWGFVNSHHGPASSIDISSRSTSSRRSLTSRSASCTPKTSVGGTQDCESTQSMLLRSATGCCGPSSAPPSRIDSFPKTLAASRVRVGNAQRNVHSSRQRQCSSWPTRSIAGCAPSYFSPA
jgi:hypothetical protein